MSRITLLALALSSTVGATTAFADDSKLLSGHKRDVNGVAISSDGKLVASGSSDNEVKLWLDGKLSSSRASDQGAVISVAISPDGKRVAAGSMYGDVTLWDPVAGKDVYSKRGQEGRITGIGFISGGKQLVTVGTDQKVRVWDAATGDAKGTLEGHKYSITGLALAPNGKTFYTSDSGGNVRAWDAGGLKDGGTFELAKDANGPAREAHAVAVSPDSKKLAVGFGDGTLVFLDAASGKEANRGKVGDSVNSLAFSPDGRFLAVGTQMEEVLVVQVDSAKQVKTLKGHSRPVTGVAVASDGTLATASLDMTVRVWSLKDLVK